MSKKAPPVTPPTLSMEKVADIVMATFKHREATFKHREAKIAENAARHATDAAVASVIAYLQSVGVLDEGGAPKPGQRLKVRIVNPRCYPPLVLQ